MSLSVTTFDDALPHINRSIRFATRHARYYREDLTQGALLRTFKRYKSGEITSLALLCHIAKQATVHEKRRMFRQVGTIPDSHTNYVRLCLFEADLPECHEGDHESDEDYRPVDELKVRYEPGPDTPEIRLADVRIDLEATLKAGFHILAATRPDLVEDMKHLMRGVMLGCTYSETAREHGWDRAYLDRLCRTMREVFGNGNYTPPTGRHKDVPDDRKQRLIALIESGTSIRSAARTIGIGRETARKIWHAAQK